MTASYVRSLKLNGSQLDSWIKLLLKENETLKSLPSFRMCGSDVTMEIYRFISVCAEETRIDEQAKYIALDIYQRFITQHIETMSDYITTKCPEKKGKKPGKPVNPLDKILSERKKTGSKNRRHIVVPEKSDSPEETQAEFLERVKERVSKQSALRVLNCLQLATKMLSNTKILSSACIRDLLHRMGHNYSVRAIAKSELRILGEIDFRCSVINSPLEYLGVLFCGLFTTLRESATIKRLSETKTNDRRLIKRSKKNKLPEASGNSKAVDYIVTTMTRSEVEELLEFEEDVYTVCCSVLHLCHLKRDDIYRDLMTQITGTDKLIPTLRDSFTELVHDRVLLTASVLMSAVSALSLPTTHVSALLTGLSTVPCEDITVMSKSITRMLLHE